MSIVAYHDERYRTIHFIPRPQMRPSEIGAEWSLGDSTLDS